MTSNRAVVDEWIRVHRQLMDQEADFNALALKATEGQISDAELEDARARLLGLRELCNVLYTKAFPQAHRQKQPT